MAIDWSKFTNYLSDLDLTFREIYTTNDIDSAVDVLISHIIDAQNFATSPRFRNHSSFIAPRYIYDLIKQRKQLRGLFQNYADPFLKPFINRLNNGIKNCLFKERQKNRTIFSKIWQATFILFS